MNYAYAYELFEAICGYYGVDVGTYPDVNNNVMISTYDNSLTGKQYIMYLAELFGGNAKIERDGSCSIFSLKNYNANTRKIKYTCTGTEEGNYYFKYNGVNYQFVMPTVEEYDVLIFDTTTLELYLDEDKISTSNGSSGTLITFSHYSNDTTIEINALTSKKLEVGNSYYLSRVCYNNLVKLYAGGNVITVDELPTTDIDTNAYYYLTTEMKYYKYNNNEWSINTDLKNTLYLRPDNIFISEQSQVDAIYNSVKGFTISNITCENRIDLSLDSWDIVRYITDDKEYYTYYDTTTTYNGVTMGTTKVNIPLKLQEETTNVTESQKVINRTVKASINQIDGRISLLSQDVSENKSDIASLEVTTQGISSSVTSLSEDLEDNYSTTTQMNSAINQKANEINLVVSTKVGEDEVISKINASSEAVTINSGKISLSGKTIDLTTDNITVDSTYLKIDKYGRLSGATKVSGVQVKSNLWVDSDCSVYVGDGQSTTTRIENDQISIAGRNVLSSRTLYNNSSGTTGTVSLSSSASSCDFINITYKDTSNLYSYHNAFIASPNYKTVQLQLVSKQGSDARLNSKTVTISGSSITSSDSQVVFPIGQGVYTSNEIAIVRVDGYYL